MASNIPKDHIEKTKDPEEASNSRAAGVLSAFAALERSSVALVGRIVLAAGGRGSSKGSECQSGESEDFRLHVWLK